MKERDPVVFSRPREISLLCVLIPLLAAASGCATFREVDTRTFKHEEVREHPVLQKLKRYHAPMAVKLPSDGDPVLVLKCEKEVDIKVKYRTPTHEDRVLERHVTGFQSTLEDLFSYLGDDDPSLVFWGAVGIPVWIGLSPVSLLTDGTHKETRYDPIAGSESSFVHYKNETKTVAAPDRQLELVGIGTGVTDSKGLVKFSAPPSAFDQGVRMVVDGASQAYVVRRTKHFRTRENKAPWRDEAKLVNNVGGHA